MNALSVSGDCFAARNSVAMVPQLRFGEMSWLTRKPGTGEPGFCARYSPRSTIAALRCSGISSVQCAQR